MSKQDIEKRLGFAAQGVKAEMASIPGITDLPYEANPQGTHRYKVGDQVKDKRHPSFRGTIKRLMRDKYGYPSYVVYTQGGGPQDAQDSDLVLASRPGVKIKFSAQFEVGRVYEHSFIGDYDAIVQWKVLSRTESTLTIKKVGEGNRNSATTPTRGEEKRVKINSDAQGEFVYPMGKFSMAPILRASKTTASRPGVKEVFVADRMTTAGALRRAMRAKGVISAGDLEWYGILASDPDSTPYLYKAGALERMEDDRHQPNIFFPAPKKKSSRPGVKAKFGRFNTEFGFLANQIKNQPDLAKKNIIVLAKKMGKEVDITRAEFEQLMQYAAKLGMETQVANAHDDVRPGFSRSGVKAKMAASDIIVKKDGQYIYYYPEDDDRATFADDNGKGAYTVKSNRTGKPVSAKTYRSIQEAAAASNEMNEKLPPLKKAKSSRPGVKAKMVASFEDRQRAAGYKWQVRYTKQLGKTDSDNAMEIDETLAFATESAARKWADTMIKKGWYKGTSGTPEKVLTAKVVPFARPAAKAKA